MRYPLILIKFHFILNLYLLFLYSFPHHLPILIKSKGGLQNLVNASIVVITFTRQSCEVVQGCHH